jgi:hypothetical protein
MPVYPYRTHERTSPVRSSRPHVEYWRAYIPSHKRWVEWCPLHRSLSMIPAQNNSALYYVQLITLSDDTLEEVFTRFNVLISSPSSE